MTSSRLLSHRMISSLTMGVGLLSLLIGMILLFVQVSNPTYAQDAPPASADDYVGATACQTCHRGLSHSFSDTPHALALQDVRQDKTPVLADFDQAEDLRRVLLPGAAEARPFTPDDIVYVMGSGRYVQRYVVAGDTGYLVLPVEWNTLTDEWQPFTLADTWPDPAYDWGANCAYCHTTGLDVTDYTWVDDGVQCETCHGPGSRHAELGRIVLDRRATSTDLLEIRGAIYLKPDPQVCGQCHSEGTEPEGGHPYPTQYRPGSNLTDAAAFNLAPRNDLVHWWSTGHARDINMQFNEWLASAHSRASNTLRSSDLAQEGCLECHSTDYRWTEEVRALFADGTLRGVPPEAVTVETAQWGVSCIECHNPHSEASEAFAVAEPYTLCVTCHQNTELFDTPHHPVMEMFEGRSLVPGIDGVPSVHFTAADGPNCITCHLTEIPVSTFTQSSHALRPVLPGAEEDGPPDTCSGCHDGLTTVDLQSLIDGTQDAVRSRLSLALARLGSVPQPDPDTEALDLYNQVVLALTFVQNDGSLGVHNYDYVDVLLNEAGRILSELSVPGTSLRPTEAPAPTAIPAAGEVANINAPSVLAPVTIRPVAVVFIGLFALVLLAGAVVFFRQRDK